MTYFACRRWLSTCLLITALNTATTSFAEDSGAAMGQEEPNAFARGYLVLALARNFPVSFSEDEFAPGKSHPYVGYRHNLGGRWLMGIGGQFRMLNEKDPLKESGDEVPFFTFTHEALRVIRLYHPAYLLIGPKIHYLLPVVTAKFPVQRNSELLPEFGAGLSVEMLQVLSERFTLSVRMDRWRGTDSMRYHALELAAGVGVALR